LEDSLASGVNRIQHRADAAAGRAELRAEQFSTATAKPIINRRLLKAT
jgi:hypothetical protein